jgi:hypothetical protein
MGMGIVGGIICLFVPEVRIECADFFAPIAQLKPQLFPLEGNFLEGN